MQTTFNKQVASVIARTVFAECAVVFSPKLINYQFVETGRPRRSAMQSYDHRYWLYCLLHFACSLTVACLFNKIMFKITVNNCFYLTHYPDFLSILYVDFIAVPNYNDKTGLQHNLKLNLKAKLMATSTT